VQPARRQRAFLFSPGMDDFLADDPGSLMHDGLPDLSQYVFIHSSLDDAGLDPFEFRIWCHLRRRAKERVAWPGMRSIAEKTGISLGKVCPIIRSLQAKGFLTATKRSGDQSNIYIVTVPEEIQRPYNKQGVHDVNATVHEVNATVHEVNATVHDVNATVHEVNATVHEVNATVHDVNTRVSIEGNPIKEKSSCISDEQFIRNLKSDKTYKGIDIDRELGKMKAWQSTHPGRRLTRRFIVNWLNRTEPSIDLKTALNEAKIVPRL